MKTAFIFLVVLSVVNSFEYRICDNKKTCTTTCNSTNPCNNATVIVCSDSVDHCSIKCDGDSVCNNVTILSSANSTDIECDGSNSCHESSFYCGDLNYANDENALNLSIYNLNSNLYFSFMNNSINQQSMTRCNLICWDDSCNDIYMGCFGSNVRECRIDAISDNSISNSIIDCDIEYTESSTECVLSCVNNSCNDVTMLCSNNLNSCECQDVTTGGEEEEGTSDRRLVAGMPQTTNVVSGIGACSNVYEIGYKNGSSSSSDTTSDTTSSSSSSNITSSTHGEDGNGGETSNNDDSTKNIIYIVIIVGVLSICCALVAFMYVQWRKSNKKVANMIVQNGSIGTGEFNSMDPSMSSGAAGYQAPLIQLDQTRGDIKFQL